MNDGSNGGEVDLQRNYYKKTADKYDDVHLSGENDEQYFALSCLAGLTDYLKVKSILDLGSGTGRTLRYLKKTCPKIKVMGIEPVKELREIAYSQGISKEELVEGDATKLNFKNSEFDLVCAFAILHHIKDNKTVVNEMLRVSKGAIFISDSNNFGHGSKISRLIKQSINALGLWKLADLIKTKGKGYTFSEGDGLAYSYSIFENYRKIKSSCQRVHIMNTTNGDINIYKTASHVALLGIK